MAYKLTHSLTQYIKYCLDDQATYWLIDMLTYWLIILMSCWPTNFMTHWLSNGRTYGAADKLTCLITDLLSNLLNSWLTNILICWLVLTKLVDDCLTDWPSELLTDWLTPDILTDWPIGLTDCRTDFCTLLNDLFLDKSTSVSEDVIKSTTKWAKRVYNSLLISLYTSILRKQELYKSWGVLNKYKESAFFKNDDMKFIHSSP